MAGGTALSHTGLCGKREGHARVGIGGGQGDY